MEVSIDCDSGVCAWTCFMFCTCVAWGGGRKQGVIIDVGCVGLYMGGVFM